ncbi:MAG: shikimate kinase [Planctomycetota bacterium]
MAATVRALRKARGWARRDLAERADISERFLADVEAAQANPSLLRLVALADAFGVALEDLLGIGAAHDRRHVALLGLRGAGKSTVGPLLAERMQLPFVELDTLVESATGLQLGEIFQLHGESYYRAAERSEVRRVLSGAPCVLAVGGGVVTDEQSLGALQERARTVWLRAAPEDHWQRVINQGDLRPMADNEQAFLDLRRILGEREPFYRRSHVVVDTSDCDVGEVVERVLRGLATAS